MSKSVRGAAIFLILRYNEEGIRDSKFIDTHFESAIVNRIKKYTFSFQGENKNNDSNRRFCYWNRARKLLLDS